MVQRKRKTPHHMCDATNFRVGRMDELRCALRLPPRRALRFSIPIAAIERDENGKIHDFTLFLLRLFYDPPNFLKKRDAPNRVVTTSRKGFQNFKEIRVFPCAKADRDRKFRNLKNMFPLAEAVFPLAENMFPLAETVFPLAETCFLYRKPRFLYRGSRGPRPWCVRGRGRRIKNLSESFLSWNDFSFQDRPRWKRQSG